MISGGNRWALLAAALAIPACAGPALESSSAKPAESSAELLPKSPHQKPDPTSNQAAVSSISLEQFFLLHQSDKTLVFDARPALFHQFGHIPSAISMPKNRCDEAIALRESEIKSALAAGKTIVVYCSGITCPDARTVAMRLSRFGHAASVFSGGWDAWKEAGMPVE